MPEKKCDIGIIGLGIMGRNLALDMADHEFAVAGYDREKDKVDRLEKEKKDGHAIRAAAQPAEFAGAAAGGHFDGAGQSTMSSHPWRRIWPPTT